MVEAYPYAADSYSQKLFKSYDKDVGISDLTG